MFVVLTKLDDPHFTLYYKIFLHQMKAVFMAGQVKKKKGLTN